MLIQHASSEVFLNGTNLVEHGYNPIKCRWYKDTMLLDPSEKQMMQSFGSRLDSLLKTWVWIKIMLVWAMSLLLFFQINISRGCFIIILHQRLTSCSQMQAQSPLEGLGHHRLWKLFLCRWKLTRKVTMIIILELDVNDDSIFWIYKRLLVTRLVAERIFGAFWRFPCLASEGFHSTSHVGFLEAFYLASWSHRVSQKIVWTW